MSDTTLVRTLGECILRQVTHVTISHYPNEKYPFITLEEQIRHENYNAMYNDFARRTIIRIYKEGEGYELFDMLRDWTEEHLIASRKPGGNKNDEELQYYKRGYIDFFGGVLKSARWVAEMYPETWGSNLDHE